MIRLNCNEKLNIIEAILKVWHARSLTLQGKIVIIKSLVIPHLLQLSSTISLSEKFLINLDRIFTNFQSPPQAEKHYCGYLFIVYIHLTIIIYISL